MTMARPGVLVRGALLLLGLLALPSGGATGACVLGAACVGASAELMQQNASASTVPVNASVSVSTLAVEYAYKLVVTQGSTVYTWRFALVPTVEAHAGPIAWSLDAYGGLCAESFDVCIPVMP